ncbi:hypothetical protein E2C01_064328 [Portunus trituberculatus]|uniref:Uncharacterized protein n=1 Tax=Portunus trituberculatus TaxID=210409 RepID=A0A5B7HCQ4_PORTR|nr:hypothetical protein [Portunus trituberculatus]
MRTITPGAAMPHLLPPFPLAYVPLFYQAVVMVVAQGRFCCDYDCGVAEGLQFPARKYAICGVLAMNG